MLHFVRARVHRHESTLLGHGMPQGAAALPLATSPRSRCPHHLRSLILLSPALLLLFAPVRSYEKKPAEVIQKDLGSDYVSRATSALTSVRGVNKTDVKTLGDRFGSLAAVLRASAAELQACPGVGPTKARRLFEA